MQMKSYKYRIYPTKEQEIILSKTFGCVRVVWNKFVEVFNSYDKIKNPNPVYESTTIMRSKIDFLKEVNAGALQQKQIDFMNFRREYFNKSRKKKLGKPNFKKKSNHQSFKLSNQKYRLGQNYIWLEKIGKINIQIDRLPKKNSKMMSVTISMTPSGKYYASVSVQENIIPIYKNSGNSVGLDLGLKEFLILSNGEKVENPRWFRNNQAKLRKTQKNLSRKVKGSSRYKKTRIKVSRLHEKIANQRKWFHHNVSLDLVRRFDFIGIESLNVSGMIKNRKLSKSISDAGWSQFISFLKYKSIWNQKTVQAIDTFFPSSKTCFECGCVNHELTLKDREWICPECHSVLDRDINAAKNIEKFSKELFKEKAQGIACAQRTQSQHKSWTAQAIDNEASKKLEICDNS